MTEFELEWDWAGPVGAVVTVQILGCYLTVVKAALVVPEFVGFQEGRSFSNRRISPSGLNATRAWKVSPSVRATHVRPLRSPLISRASMRSQPVSFLIRPTSRRN
jgi:hypothetical protein